ncbi:MAG: choline/ethanolamine kinase family protein [Anaerolineales bacterium]
MPQPSLAPGVPAAMADLAEQVPAWHGQDLRISPLSGGITNRNYKVEAGGQSYVLRLGGANTHLLGIDRHTEYAAALAAAAIQAGPEVLHFIAPQGYLVTHFITGRNLPPAEMRQPGIIRQVAGLLRRVHSLPPIPGSFSAFQVVRDYRRAAADHGAACCPPETDWLFEAAGRIERAVAQTAPPACPCHNDLLNENFLLETHSGELRLLDWEYAGMGDLTFDLANLSAQHDFGPVEDQALLQAYFGDDASPRYARLQLMKIMSDFREAMWGALQSAISALDFDFQSYATRYFGRVSAGMNDPNFNRWLDESGRGDHIVAE